MPESNEEFTQIINEFKALKPGSYVGLDTEDTGLDYNKDQVVGVCVARLDDKYKYVGYYLPVRHNVEGVNLPICRVFKFTNWCIKRFRCVLFNRSYDFSMLEREEEIEITGFNHDDCQILCWEARYDKFPSLKKFYRLYCKKDIDSFAETVKSSRKAEDSLDETDENSHNFGETDPRYSYPYGAFDPVATLELFFTMMKLFPYTRVIYPLDNRLGEVIRRFTKQEFNLDYAEVRRQLEIEQAKLRQYQREVYEIAGYQFNIKSTREKAEALMRFVTLTVKTKKGQYKVDEEVLKEIDHPLAEAMLKYTEVFTFVNNYLNKLLSVEGTPLRINYKTCEAPTGRLATGQSRGNSFYSPINISAIPSDAEMLYVHKSDGPIPFIANREKEGAIGMVECKAGIRTAFTAPEGYVFMTADFCSEELRLVGNLSKEQTFIQAVKNGEDLHMATARRVFGVEDKGLRKKMKTCWGAGTWFNTKEGLRREPESLISPQGRQVEITNLEVTETEGFEVIFSNGVKSWVSKEHKFLIYDKIEPEWVTVSECVGSQLLLKPSVEGKNKTFYLGEGCKKQTFHGNLVIDEDVAYLLGCLVGDGSCCKNKSGRWASFGLVVEDNREAIESALRRVKVEPRVSWRKAKAGYVYGIATWNSTAFGEWFHREFYNEYGKTIPDWLMEASLNVRESFIAGLIDTDGRVNKCAFDYCTTSDHLAQRAAELLQSCGLWVKYHRSKGKCRGKEEVCHEFSIKTSERIPLKLSRKVVYRRTEPANLGWRIERGEWSKKSWSEDRELYYYHKGQSKQITLRQARRLRIPHAEGVPLIILSVTPKLGKAVVLECEGHLYQALGLDSHNCNFGVLYGMSVPSLAKRLKVSIFEATKLKARYDQRMSNLTKWIKVQHQRGRKNMWVETFFGRRRPLDQWYNTSDPGKIGFANRSAINTPVQGCLPAFCLFEFKDYAVSAKHERQKLKEHDNPTGGKGVITFRGDSICNFHFSRTGEFFVCDTYHKILDDKNHLVQACTLDKKTKVQLSPLQKKKFLLQGIFSVQESPLARAASFIKKKNLVNKEKLLYKLFAQAWLQGESITLSIQDAVNLRTVASMHGWNLILDDFDGEKCICKLKWSRKKTAKFGAIRPLGRMPIASVSVRFGRPTYYSQGVMHKNTAADILRMKLCQLYDKMQNDEYWKENVIVGWSVYDEIELYVKENAWRRVFKEFERFMFYQADNWEIPVEVDTGVGSSWGQCLDLEINDKHQIVGIKKVEWFDGMNPFKDGQVY